MTSPNIENQFVITDRARAHLATIPEVKAGQKLRIMVEGGGCAGFQYIFSFTDKTNDDDVEFTNDAVAVVIDKVSLPFVAAGQLDFEEKLMGSFLNIKNPNAKSGCGCGNSFSIG
ncbi:MAG: iron-sulfur cluster assembly accessory protein [Hydrotalea sp.]|nr:iron-sulfur cluster assembly accessory protein [Hydrotalea sp.]